MTHSPRVLLDAKKISLIIDRMCHELIERHGNFSNAVLLGIQPRGTLFSDKIFERLNKISKANYLKYGKIDPTFYRDDFRFNDNLILPNTIELDFELDKKDVILVDDVFFTGRTVRAAMDALLDYGRPDKVELLVLIDRRFNRHLPIQADFVGKTVDSVISEKVKVVWKGEGEKEDKVILFESEEK